MKFYEDSSSSTLTMEVTCGLYGYTFIHSPSSRYTFTLDFIPTQVLKSKNHMFTH